MILVERDYQIMREIERWRFCQGRHIQLLAGFGNQRATDRRLRLLLEAGYIERQKVIYGVAGIYFLTHKGKMIIGANKRPDKVRLDNVNHDIAVLDTAIYFHLKYKMDFPSVVTEKQLHIIDGFGIRKHQPDFVYQNQEKYCFEIELSQKAKDKLEANIKANYTNFDQQIWVIPQNALKIKRFVLEYAETYPNIKIIELEEIQNYVRNYRENQLSELKNTN